MPPQERLQALKELFRLNILLHTSVIVLGLGTYYLTTRGSEERQSQELLALKLEQKLGLKQSTANDSTKNAIQKMLSELENKTMRQKLEAASDAAHKSHRIGFRNSPSDPVDAPMPTSFSQSTDTSFSDIATGDK